MQRVEKRQISVHCIMACLYFLLLPTTIAVDSAGNSILKLATIPIAGYFLVTLILSNRKLQINSVQLALLLYTLSVVGTLFVAADSVSVINVVGYVLNAALYICLTIIPYNKKELELMEKVQIVLLIILNFLTLFSSGSEDDRTTLMIMGQTSDPNYFIGFFIFPLTIALKYLISGKNRLLYLLLIGVTIYSVLLSGSRGGFLAVMVTAGCFFLLYPSTGILKRMCLFVGGLAFIFLLWTLLKPILPENIVERMSVDAVVETHGTGRVDIWISMVREIWEQPKKLLLGRGIMSMHQVFLDGSSENVVAHNQIIQTLYNQGLLGLLAFLVLTGISFFRCIKHRKTVSIAILGMMALSISLSFNQTTRTFWNLIAYAAFAFPDTHTNTTDNGGLSDNECS